MRNEEDLWYVFGGGGGREGETQILVCSKELQSIARAAIQNPQQLLESEGLSR